jgi:photosystem II stability/assembly factor-like uncharacterized protein
MGDPMHQITRAILLGTFLMLSVEGSHAEWTRMRHPGSDIRSLAFSGSTLFAVGSKNRMYRTIDSGLSWTQVSLSGTRATPNRAYNVLALYSECALLGTSDGLIYRGNSNGSAWGVASITGTDEMLAFTRSQGKTAVTFLACGLGNGIRLSSDSGKTWILSNAGLTNLNVTALGSGRSLPDSTGQVLFAGTYGDGVFVSCDNGQTWSPTGQSPSVSNITSLHVDGDYLVITGSGGKVCSSSDGGNSWKDVGAGLPYTEVLCLTILGDTTNEWFYCGTVDEGVWRCPSSGGEWTPCNSGLQNLRINTILLEGGALYLGTNEGVYRSCDAGTSWTAIGDGTMPRLTSIHAMPTLEPNSKDLLVAGTVKTYAATPMYAPSSTTFSTTDGGTNWITTEALFEGQVISITHRDQLLFLLSEGSTNHIGGLNLSNDMGGTWELHSPLAAAPYACMEIALKKEESGLDCYLGSSGGPLTGVQFSSDTGRTWSEITRSVTYSIGTIDSFLIVGGASGVLRTSNYGATWEDITSNLGGHAATSFTDDEERLFAYGSGGIVVTSDGGNTWLPAGLAGKAVTSLASIDSCLLAAADGRVYAGTRETFDWTDVTDDLAGVPVGSITATSQTCYVLQSDGKRLWKRPMTEILDEIQHIPSAPALVDPPNNSIVYSDSIRFVWRRVTGSGITYAFELATDSLFKFKVADSSIVDTTRLQEGLFKGERYWWRVRARARNAVDWGPYSSTNRFEISLTSVERQSEFPNVFSLAQNYPNPFNPATLIRYAVPIRSHVTLTVFNILGQAVAELVNCETEVGYYSVRFEAEGLASGMYLYRLQAGDFMAVRKLLVLR